MADQRALAKELEEAISVYVEARKGRSLATLAKSAGVGYTTVRRLAQGEAIPNQETTFAIIDIIMGTQDKVDFLNKYYPMIGKLMGEVYSEDFPNQPESDELLRYFRSMETHNFVFNIAATSYGTSVDQISRLAGERGLQALDEMVERGILIRAVDGRVHYASESWTCSNVSEVLQQIGHSLSYFDKSLVGSDVNRLMHMTASVNIHALRKINNLVKDFMIKVVKIKDHTNSVGDIPFYADFVMSVYDRQKYIENGGD